MNDKGGPGVAGFLLRWLFAALLVFATYNPTGFSYVHWLVAQISHPTPYLALAGIVLIIGWVVFVRATLSSLGMLGLLLSVAFVACVVWLMIDWALFSLADASAIAWLVLAGLSFILAVGLSWSHLRRRLTGQVDVDELEHE